MRPSSAAPVATVVSAAALLGAGPLLYRLSPLGGSLAAVALAVVFACAVSRGVTSLAVGTGALGALAAAVLGGITTPVGGAVLLAAALTDRLLRVRGPISRAAHLALSLATGAGAAQIVHMYVAAPLPVRLVALSMAVVVALAPLLVPADDPLAHTLETRARALPADVARLLREAADLRRQVHDVALPPSAQQSVGRSWRILRELVEARVRLEPARVRKMTSARLGSDTSITGEDALTAVVDRRIEEHVALLARDYSSVDTAYAAAFGLDAATLAAPDGTPKAPR